MWVCAALVAGTVGSAEAQLVNGNVVALPEAIAANTSHVESASEANLPDAPGVSESSSSSGDLALTPPPPGVPGSTTPREAGKYDTVILPGQKAGKLTVHDKVIYGIRDSFSPISIVGWGLSAAYEQVTDGSPNYGVIHNTQTGKSFAQRLGAASARDTSETIFGESILAPVFHEDPRYYAQTNRKFLYRVAYAATRPIITRTDGGRTTVNFSNLGGNLAGSALAQAYYPPLNQGFTEVMKTFGGSIGGSALGDLASEFLPGLLEAVHFKKKL